MREIGGIRVVVEGSNMYLYQPRTGIRLMAIKLIGGTESVVRRAVEAASQGYYPDCYLAAYGLADSEAIGENSVFKDTRPLPTHPPRPK